MEVIDLTSISEKKKKMKKKERKKEKKREKKFIYIISEIVVSEVIGRSSNKLIANGI